MFTQLVNSWALEILFAMGKLSKTGNKHIFNFCLNVLTFSKPITYYHE